MAHIQTVTGDIDPGALGVCMTHEHVICDERLAPRSHLTPGEGMEKSYMVLDDEERAIEELKRYYDLGGRALVEVTSTGWGRDVEKLAAISGATGVRMVAMAGFYIEPCLPLEVDEWSIERLTEWLVREVTEGIDDTGIKAGVYKSGIWRCRIEGPELKGLRAVARATLQTGVAITTHTTGSRRYEVTGGNMGWEHLRVLLEEGVDGDRLIVGHADERPDINFLNELADMGCYIQFDTVGKDRWMRDETRADLIKELIARGHGGRMLLATDRCRKKELYEELGGLGYVHLLASFVDTMKEAGIPDPDIDRILVENPATCLAVSI